MMYTGKRERETYDEIDTSDHHDQDEWGRTNKPYFYNYALESVFYIL